MTGNLKNAAGTVILWSAAALSLLGAIFSAKSMPAAALASFIFAIPAALLGAFIKKKYCPRCLAGSCQNIRNKK